MAAKCRGTIPKSQTTWPTSSIGDTEIWSQYANSVFPYVVIVPNVFKNKYEWAQRHSTGWRGIGWMRKPYGKYEFWQEGKCRGNQLCGKWASVGSVDTETLVYRINNSNTWTTTTMNGFFGNTSSVYTDILDKFPTGKFDFYTGFTKNCVQPSKTSSFKTIYKLPWAISWTLPSNKTVGSFNLPNSFFGAPFTVNGYKACYLTPSGQGGNMVWSCAPTTISIPSTNGLYAEAGTGWNLSNLTSAFPKVAGLSVVLTTSGQVIVQKPSTLRQVKWHCNISANIPQTGGDISSFYQPKLEIIL
jgi:hypothetical protein